MQTAAEMCDLTLPWRRRRCCCSQLCTGIALMCEGEQKVIWLENMGLFWSFRQSSPLTSFAWEYINVSGNARRPGESTSWSRGVGSISFSSNYYLNYLKIIMQSLSRLCGRVPPLWGLEHQHRSVLPGWAPLRDTWQKPAKSFTFLQGLNLWHAKLMPQPRTVSASIVFKYSVWARQRQHF